MATTGPAVTPPFPRAVLAAMIDHTLLRPEATQLEVEALWAEACQLSVFAVCVNPSMLPITSLLTSVSGSPVHVATVIGFPSGAHQASVKADEAARAVQTGATELDMVINLGLAKQGKWGLVVDEISRVRAIAPDVLLKVILESAVLTTDEIVHACRAAEASGADFVKTSTGFHPAGGATIEAVEIMRASVGDRLGVKASGGIRTTEQALDMVRAGASRLGTSATAAILDGLTGREPAAL